MAVAPMTRQSLLTQFRNRLSINEGGEILMSWTKFACLFSFCALLAAPVMAQPTASLVGVDAGGGMFDWTLSFTPDDSLYDNDPPNGVGGSIAVEFSLETDSGMLVQDSFAVDANYMEDINGTPIINLGDDPYSGGPTEGTTDYTNVASALNLGVNVDAIFAPLGSTYFTSAGPFDALTFTTMSSSVTFGGLIAQDNNNGDNSDDIYTIDPVTVDVGLIGDTNGDGKVDLQDLFNVQNNFGGSTPPDLGDTDGDGDIDLQDLFNVQNNFGATTGAGVVQVQAASVPEPMSSIIVMGAMALSGIVGVCRQRCA